MITNLRLWFVRGQVTNNDYLNVCGFHLGRFFRICFLEGTSNNNGVPISLGTLSIRDRQDLINYGFVSAVRRSTVFEPLHGNLSGWLPSQYGLIFRFQGYEVLVPCWHQNVVWVNMQPIMGIEGPGIFNGHVLTSIWNMPDFTNKKICDGSINVAAILPRDNRNFIEDPFSAAVLGGIIYGGIAVSNWKWSWWAARFGTNLNVLVTSKINS